MNLVLGGRRWRSDLEKVDVIETSLERIVKTSRRISERSSDDGGRVVAFVAPVQVGHQVALRHRRSLDHRRVCRSQPDELASEFLLQQQEVGGREVAVVPPLDAVSHLEKSTSG